MFNSIQKKRTATLKSNLQFTEYFWGDKSEIVGKTLQVLDVSQDGKSSYLCYVADKGLIDVDYRDIASQNF